MSRCRVIVELLCIRRPTNITDRARHADEAEAEEELLGPKLLLVMGCVKLGEKNCVHLISVGEQNAN